MKYFVVYVSGSVEIPIVLREFTASMNRMLNEGWELSGELHIDSDQHSCRIYQVVIQREVAEPAPPARRGGKTHAVQTE